jgi:antitoxin component YwqK of YwqJK toxin-antitoxin module
MVPQFFSTVLYHQSNGVDLRVDFFRHGPKASETLMKNGLRHQNSESYYESGEQFRSALYYRDILLTEIYFLNQEIPLNMFQN